MAGIGFELRKILARDSYTATLRAYVYAGLNSSFTVRKISHGFGVERVFQTHSAIIDSVEVKRRV